MASNDTVIQKVSDAPGANVGSGRHRYQSRRPETFRAGVAKSGPRSTQPSRPRFGSIRMTASRPSPTSEIGTGPRVTGLCTQMSSSSRVSQTYGALAGSGLGTPGPG